MMQIMQNPSLMGSTACREELEGEKRVCVRRERALCLSVVIVVE
jgi:hypothetical protein